MELLYFGWMRAKIGTDREELDPPPEVTDVRSLVDYLKARGGGYADGLRDLSVVRVAVNQEMTDLDAPIAKGDEVALFPPMTGG